MADLFPHIPVSGTISAMPLMMLQAYSSFYELPIQDRTIDQLRANLQALRFIFQGDITAVTDFERRQLFTDYGLEGDVATLDTGKLLVVIVNHVFGLVMRYNAIGYCRSEGLVEQTAPPLTEFTGSGTCQITVQVEDTRP